jgi:hypothetical protein
MKTFARLLAIIALAFIGVGCATKPLPPEIRYITNTEYVVVEVPTTLLAPTAISKSVNTGCTGAIDWRECATSRAKTIVNLYGDIGQCNADKYKANAFITEQSKIIKERNKKHE